MQREVEVDDPIYGVTVIEEPVLVELANCKAMRRLEGVSQFGMPDRLYPFPGFSRYEHSVGTAILLGKLEASLEEQAAGMIHDVSHPAFSHLVDWVIGNREKEDHQDKSHKRVVFSSDIPKILLKYGFEPEEIIDVKRYGLLERETPDLCADRVDYALREFESWAAPYAVKNCLWDLVNFKGRIAFNNGVSACEFGEAYARCQREHWGGAECVVRWEILAQTLKHALKKRIIEIKDFELEDEQVLRKLTINGDAEIGANLGLLERKRLHLRENTKNPQYALKKKFRYIDPHFVENGKLYQLSKESKTYRRFLEEQKEINERGINVDIV